MRESFLRNAVGVSALAVVVVGLAGCGGSEQSAAAPTTSLAPYTPGSIARAGVEGAEQSAAASSAAEASRAAAFAREGAARLSEALEQEGLTYTVADGQLVCSALKTGHVAGIYYDFTSTQFLVEHEHVGPGDSRGRGAVLAVQSLCPEFQGAVDQVEGGEWYFAPFTIPGDGSYKVGPDIPTGRYRASGVGSLVTDCYWERSTSSGETLANDYVTAAQQLTQGAGAAGGIFTTRGCGSWERIG